MRGEYPLQWPEDRPRRTTLPQRSRFDVTLAAARDALMRELHLLGAKNAILSTNMELRLDGLPRAGRTEPDDTAAAVYFEYDGADMCFACDRWDKVGDNVQAVRHTIAALRGIRRWGTGDMVSAAFTGYLRLPPPATTAGRDWWVVLDCVEAAGYPEVSESYMRLTKEHHPDVGGDSDVMAEINAAFDFYVEHVAPI